MKKIDLLIAVYYGYYLFERDYYRVRVKIQTARGLLKKAKELAIDYGFNYYSGFESAHVYLFDPSKKIYNPLKRGDLLKLEPLSNNFYKLENLFNTGGYLAIAQTVKNVQGIKLREGREKRKKNKKTY